MARQLATPSSAAALVVAGLLSAAALPPAAAVASDWPQYRGANGDGASADTGVAKGLAKAKVAWKVPVGEGFGTFAVAGDKAYLFADRGGRETVLAFDAKTGKELWAKPVDGTITDKQGGSNPRSTPAVGDGKVYAFSVNQKLVCLDAADGKQVWAHDLKEETGGQNLQWGNAISPVLDGDKVFVAAGGSGKSMLAFAAADGKPLWATGSEKITHASPALATIGGVKQVVYFMQSGLVSLAAEDGKELWRAKFPYKVSTAASPIVGTGKDEGLVYCSAGYDVGSAVFKVTNSGGAFAAHQVWFQPSEGKQGANVNHWSTPVYHDGHIYGIFGFKDFAGKKGGAGGPVRCLEMATGKFKWAQPGFGSGGGTVYVDGHVLALGDAGKLALIEASPAGYKEVGSMTLPGEKFWSAAVVANGKIFARSKTEAFCIDVSK
jgi:outer membrane protein assembly factor BamB